MDPTSIARLEASSGCSIDRNSAGGFHGAACPTFASRVQLLDDLAWHDARFDGAVRRAALEIVGPLRTREPEETAPAIHAYVRDRVPYLGEGTETFQASSDTLKYGGDCDDSARVILALARSIALPCRLNARQGTGGNQGHAFAELWDGSEYRAAEASIPARFGEQPIDALKRLRRAGLVRARARTDLASFAGVELGELGAPSTINADAVARVVILAAWSATVGAPSATLAAVQAVQAICRFETFYSKGWHLDPDPNNWGADQCTRPGPGGVCPPGTFPHTDTHADGSTYTACFCAHETPEAGAGAVIRILLNRGIGPVLGSGDATRIARAMKAAHYFEAPTTLYANAIATNAAAIAKALGEPLAVTGGGSPVLPIVAVLGGAAVTAGIWYYTRRRRNRRIQT